MTLILVLILGCSTIGMTQEENKSQFEQKHYVGTQAFVLFTAFLDPSPEFYQLNYGYRFTPKDELSLELITWRFDGPQGRQYGPDYEKEASNYPGDVKAAGAGLAYKRLLWKGLYGQVHSTAFHQSYRDEEKVKVKEGFMLFNTLRFGYHFKLLKGRLFIAPSIAATYWPIYTNLPDSFQQEEDKWGCFFLGEPGLHIGFTF